MFQLRECLDVFDAARSDLKSRLRSGFARARLKLREARGARPAHVDQGYQRKECWRPATMARQAQPFSLTSPFACRSL